MLKETAQGGEEVGESSQWDPGNGGIQAERYRKKALRPEFFLNLISKWLHNDHSFIKVSSKFR